MILTEKSVISPLLQTQKFFQVIRGLSSYLKSKIYIEILNRVLAFFWDTMAKTDFFGFLY